MFVKAALAALTAAAAAFASAEELSELPSNCRWITVTTTIPAPTPTHDPSHWIVPSLPDCDMNIPLTYSGLLEHPSEKPDGTKGSHHMYFWYTPAETQSNDFIIWLNGGPGCSSLMGQFINNGPVRFDGSADKCSSNPYSWTKKADMLYIDQPGSTGFSYGFECESPQQAMDDLYAFLSEFAKYFPDILKKDIHIAGESFAGIWVPYLVDGIVYDNNGDNHKNLPLKIKDISLGNALIGNTGAHQLIPNGKALNSEPAKSNIGYDQSILDEFARRDKVAGFKDTLDQVTYPPKGRIESPSSLPEGAAYKREDKSASSAAVKDAIDAIKKFPEFDSLDPILYLYQQGFPSKGVGNKCLSMYDVTHQCKDGDRFNAYWGKYLDRDDVRKALHAEKSPGKFDHYNPNSPTDLTGCNADVMNKMNSVIVEPPSYKLFKKFINDGIKVHLYSGERDLAMNHFGTELVIQNTTWSDQQGFQSKPSESLGQGKAIYHQEAGLSYTLFHDAGHVIGKDDPQTYLYWLGKILGH